MGSSHYESACGPGLMVGGWGGGVGRAFFSSSLCCLGSVFQSLWFLGHHGHSLLVAYPRLMASFTETYWGPAPVGSRDSLGRTALVKG